MIVAGGGVRHSGAARELVALAEALQIPVVTSLNGKDTIPGSHPLSCGVVGTYSRESANKVVNAADLICFVGTTTGGMTTHFWAVPKIGTPAIQIDIDPEALGLNYPLQARVNGDAKVTLAKMLAACDKSTAGKRKAWVAQAQGIVKEWYAKYKTDAGIGRGADPSGAHLPRAVEARARRRHRRASTPATPACGWAACTICAPTSRATCAAPAISAGRFRRGSAPSAARRIGRW